MLNVVNWRIVQNILYILYMYLLHVCLACVFDIVSFSLIGSFCHMKFIYINVGFIFFDHVKDS